MVKRLVVCLVFSATLFVPLAAAKSSYDFSVVAIGDIAAEGGGQDRTAELTKKLNPDLFLPLGDIAYPNGSADNFAKYYDPYFGSLKSITRPVAGNHEYQTPKAGGFYGYFDPNNVGLYGTKDKGSYYTFKKGSWLFIALDSECDKIDCKAESVWLSEVIKNNQSSCMVAYWHKPRFANYGVSHQDNVLVDDFWRQLVGKASFVLNGHAHIYSRTKPLNSEGTAGSANSTMSQFIVGTGGAESHSSDVDVAGVNYARLDKQAAAVYGVLKVDFEGNQYSYKFYNDKEVVLDSGAGIGNCKAPTSEARVASELVSAIPGTKPATKFLAVFAALAVFGAAWYFLRIKRRHSKK